MNLDDLDCCGLPPHNISGRVTDVFRLEVLRKTLQGIVQVSRAVNIFQNPSVNQVSARARHQLLCGSPKLMLELLRKELCRLRLYQVVFGAAVKTRFSTFTGIIFGGIGTTCGQCAGARLNGCHRKGEPLPAPPRFPAATVEAPPTAKLASGC